MTWILILMISGSDLISSIPGFTSQKACVWAGESAVKAYHGGLSQRAIYVCAQQ